VLRFFVSFAPVSNQIYDKKTVRGWTFYDWANSVYSLVISTAIFPIYYNSVTTQGKSDLITFLGFETKNSTLYSYTLSFSFLIVAFISPFLSGVADYTNRKKSFLRRFCYIGAIACGSLFFFEGVSTLWLGLLATVFASIGFWGSQVFYNAYLPEIAPKSLQDKISARGYAMGYFGSSILLILCLVLIEGGFLEKGLATRLSFLLVGLWWAGFAQITFWRLPEAKERKSIHFRTLINGYREVIGVWKKLQERPYVRRYLISFIFFSMGVQTVILLATFFGDKELGLDTSKLIVTILLIQFVGIAGASLFSYLSNLWGNLTSLKIAIVLWIVVCLSAFLLEKEDPHVEIKFYALGALVGLVMGGIQSLARSTYSKMLPKKGEHSTYFSFYDVSEKVAIVIGTFAYGFIEDLTGSMHNSALGLGIFFIVSIVVLQTVSNKAFIRD
tara:strand:- start:3054 stop:4382 length:1329 start_codon:yes stop_codon:yes gene_type:complete